MATRRFILQCATCERQVAPDDDDTARCVCGTETAVQDELTGILAMFVEVSDATTAVVMGLAQPQTSYARPDP